MTDTDHGLDEEVMINRKLPRGWRLIDGATGRIEVSVEEAQALIRSWFELEQTWRETQ